MITVTITFKTLILNDDVEIFKLIKVWVTIKTMVRKENDTERYNAVERMVQKDNGVERQWYGKMKVLKDIGMER